MSVRLLRESSARLSDLINFIRLHIVMLQIMLICTHKIYILLNFLPDATQNAKWEIVLAESFMVLLII